MELLNNRSPAQMPAAACITAWELTRKNISAVSGGGIHTPYGTISDTIFFVGTLTEKIQRNGRLSSLRVSDPTGVLTFSLSPQNTRLLRTADALDVPCFVAITASVRLRTYAGKTYIELIPEMLSWVPWIKPYLWVQGRRPLERVRVFPDSKTERTPTVF